MIAGNENNFPMMVKKQILLSIHHRGVGRAKQGKMTAVYHSYNNAGIECTAAGTKLRSNFVCEERRRKPSTGGQSADPSGYPDGWNNLAYVNNNVLNAVDPLGLCTLVEGHYEYFPTFDETMWVAPYWVHTGYTTTQISRQTMTGATLSAQRVRVNCGDNSAGSMTINGSTSSVNGSITIKGVSVGYSYTGKSVSVTVNAQTYSCGNHNDPQVGHGYREYAAYYYYVISGYESVCACGADKKYHTETSTIWGTKIIYQQDCD